MPVCNFDLIIIRTRSESRISHQHNSFSLCGKSAYEFCSLFISNFRHLTFIMIQLMDNQSFSKNSSQHLQSLNKSKAALLKTWFVALKNNFATSVMILFGLSNRYFLYQFSNCYCLVSRSSECGLFVQGLSAVFPLGTSEILR